MADLYPDEEGYIADGMLIGFCKAAGSIEINEAVSLGVTGVSGVVSVLAAAALGDACAVALKAAVTDDFIPVCFYGVVKMVVGTATFTTGAIVYNSAIGTHVEIIPSTDTTPGIIAFRGISGDGTVFRLGTALQPGSTAADEALILIGGLR